ncbi:unnamed protein product [Protopolystoma xenopodis]|uniref:Uncharacterized protein n=1 Tax=Protopolystoma xenopodis TaxID=117903 RepID=A0A3S5FES9_9PLAT|nr:unnamed protein product [Protopolystoma xenopodis]
MARLTDDADYDAGETSGNVTRPRSSSGNDHAYYVLRTRCVPLCHPTNMIELRKAGQTTFILIFLWEGTSYSSVDFKNNLLFNTITYINWSNVSNLLDPCIIIL